MLNLFRSWNDRPRHQEPSRRTQVRALIRLSLLVLIVGISVLGEAHGYRRPDAIAPAPPPLDKAALPQDPALRARTVFRHSVVPGGVLTADEVETAIGRDGIVAAHYSAINPRALHVETLPKDRAVYMSYRIGDKVFWTKRPVWLRQGETILTDGAHQIRTRCGNCISFAPMSPTSDEEPGEMEFDALVGDPGVQSHDPLGSELVSVGPVGLPLMLLAEEDPDSDGWPIGHLGGGWLGMHLFGSANGLTDPELSADLLFPSFDDEPALDGFPVFTGPSTYPPPTYPPPQSRYDPADPGQPGGTDGPGGTGSPEGPEDGRNPTFPPSADPVVPVPEPTTLLLLGGGLSALFARRRRR